MLKEKPDFLDTDMEIRKAEVALAKLYAGQASLFHPVASYLAKKVLMCEYI